MTEREITGDARSSYKKATLIAKDRNLTDAEMIDIADGVREFDAQRRPDSRLASALEKIAEVVTSQHKGGEGTTSGHEFEERRLRRREVYAWELMAVAMMTEEIGDESLAAIQRSDNFKRLVTRLTTQAQTGSFPPDGPA